MDEPLDEPDEPEELDEPEEFDEPDEPDEADADELEDVDEPEGLEEDPPSCFAAPSPGDEDDESAAALEPFLPEDRESVL